MNYNNLQRHQYAPGTSLLVSKWKRSYDLTLVFRGERFKVRGIERKLWVDWPVDGGRHFILCNWDSFQPIPFASDVKYTLTATLIWVSDREASTPSYLDTPFRYHFWGGGFGDHDAPTPRVPVGC